MNLGGWLMIATDWQHMENKENEKVWHIKQIGFKGTKERVKDCNIFFFLNFHIV